MEQSGISKITVKHFLNTALGSKRCIVLGGEDGSKPKFESRKRSPLYVKLIFKRKTTQLKSIVDGEYLSLKEASKDNAIIIAMEKLALEDLIAQDHTKYKSDFDFKRVVGNYEILKKSTIEFFRQKYMQDEFVKTILKTRSEFMGLLLKNFAVSSVILYKAAIKLIGPNPDILKLKENFEMYEQIQKCFVKKKKNFEFPKYSFSKGTVLNWVYGDLKDIFASEANKIGISYTKINLMVSEIDAVIRKEIQI